jgi:hypothetical protein
MKRDEIIKYLEKLGEELAARGKSGEILLTGGAAMCIAHEARDMTKDVDALYEPKSEIGEIARKIAREEGLPEDWLNDSVKGFLTANAPSEELIEMKGIVVTTVTPEYLLAMKLMASRYGEKDAEDIAFLMKKLDITTAGQAEDILTKYYPENMILPKTRYVIEEYMSSVAPEASRKSR